MTELSKIELDGTEDDVSFDAAELGAMMREMRKALQRDLKDVAQELRIRRPYLEAIEDGRLDDLPGPAYTTGFLRSYSDYLGMDGEDIVARFKQAGIDIDRRTNLILPSPLEEGRLPTGSVLLFAALFAVVAYGGWYYVSTGDQGSVDQVASVPSEYEPLSKVSQPVGADLPIGAYAPGGVPAVTTDAETSSGSVGEISSAAPSVADKTAKSMPAPALQQPKTEKPATVASAAVPRQITAEPSARPDETPKIPQAPAADRRRNPPAEASAGEAEAESVQARAAPVREPAAASDIAPAVRADAASDATIVIRAIEDSWIEVRVGRQKPLLSRLMREGESFEVASRPGLKMVTGNAGGVALEVNGTSVPPLGTAGQILQDVSIDAKALLNRVPANP